VQYRPLGKTGLPVSEIGYGAWGIGGSGWIGAQERVTRSVRGKKYSTAERSASRGPHHNVTLG